MLLLFYKIKRHRFLDAFFRWLISTRKRIGYCEDAGDYCHDYAADVGVLCFLIYCVGNKHRQGQYHDYGEEPYTHNSGYWIKHHFAGGKECDVLHRDHKHRADEYKEHLPYNAAPGLFAHIGVVVAVGCHAGCDIVNQPEGKEAEYFKDMMRFKGSDGCKAPQTVVGKEEIVGEEHDGKCAANNGKRKYYSADHFFFAYTYASFLKVNGELLVVTSDGEDGKETAKKRPGADGKRAALIPDADKHRTDKADNKAEEIEGNAKHRAPDILAPVSLFSISLKSGPGKNVAFGLKNSKVRKLKE